MNRLSSMAETLSGVACRVLRAVGGRLADGRWTIRDGYVEAMLVTNHVLSGAIIGAVIRRPVPAFALGVASHFALDMVPHWGGIRDQRKFLQIAVPDGLIGLAVIGTMAAIAPPERRLTVLAGMAGAALPDLDKPSRLFFGRSPFPRAWDRLHHSVQREAPGRAHREIAAAASLAAAAFVLLRAARHDERRLADWG
jgi:hypothetical protein